MAIEGAALNEYAQNMNARSVAGEEAKTLWGDLDAFYYRVETQFLNPFGYIPIVGIPVGVTRIVMGVAQETIGSVGLIFEMISGALSSSRVRSIKHYDGAGACYEQIFHGLLNKFRGVIEIVPILPLLTLLPYDATGCFFRYRTGLQNCSIVPISQRIDVLEEAK